MKGANMDYFFNAEEVFHIAVLIEQNGEKFYRHLETLVDEATTKEICLRLARQEHEHKLLFEKLLSDLVNSKSLQYNLKDLPQENLSYMKSLSESNVFARALDLDAISKKIKNTRDAITTALGFEKDTIVFFLQMKKFTRPEWGQAEINNLIEQEEEHIRILSGLLSEKQQ
ncbi:MAG: ferritin family protein [Planctomycetota bacterium]